MPKDLLVYMNTYKRYDNTLASAILSVINQTQKFDKFIIFDDTPEEEAKDMREIEHFNYLFKLMSQKGVIWEVRYGQRKGAHFNHEQANMEGYKLAFFIDDDHVLEPNCLEELMKEMRDDVGAVGGLILQPPAGPLPPDANNKINNLYLPNIQWFTWPGTTPREVEHIYSSYLHRCGIAHYNLALSSVAFRGETMFTHSLKLAGYKLLITPKAVTWHFQSTGGIHSGQKIDNWNHDQSVFDEWYKFILSGSKLMVLNCGLGDHIVFKKLLPELRAKHEKITLAVCYPELFEDETDLNIISIESAKNIIGDLDTHNVYKYCIDHDWKGSLEDAYREMFL
ncbi:glycosyltransferase [bacterium]|nr:MAG: glycosyltransferase [bacterium]